MSVSVTGEKELLRKINKMSVDLQQATREAVYGTAQSVRTYAIKSISRDVSLGQSYIRGATIHTASRPGDAPNTDTGALARSVNLQPLKPSHEMYVGTSLEYGKYLEHGTSDMEARPWLHPALEANDETLRSELEKAIDRQLEKAAR